MNGNKYSNFHFTVNFLQISKVSCSRPKHPIQKKKQYLIRLCCTKFFVEFSSYVHLFNVPGSSCHKSILTDVVFLRMLHCHWQDPKHTALHNDTIDSVNPESNEGIERPRPNSMDTILYTLPFLSLVLKPEHFSSLKHWP